MLETEPQLDAAIASSPLAGRDVVCFSHDWSGDPLSKTHLMRLAARHSRILWVNSIGYRTPSPSKADLGRAFKKLSAAAAPIREVEPNIFVLNPLAIPLYSKKWVRGVNRSILVRQVRGAMRRLGFRRPINWIFNPTAAVVAGQLGEDTVLYHCVDEYSAFSGVSAEAIAALERELIDRADLVIVSADRLYQSKSSSARRAAVVRHGVDYEHFSRALDPHTIVPEDVARLPRPIIGFFGLIADWVDTELIARIARDFSTGSVVMLGKATTNVDCLVALSNVHMLGRKPYADLPRYCKVFDAALMPFRINELTLNANPLKVREYLAAGVPVVSTRIPEVEAVPACRIADDADSFVAELRTVLNEPVDRRRISETMKTESWSARMHEIEGLLASLVRNRDGGRP